MDYFADIFLGAGALAAAFYCLILSRKLSKLSGLDQDLGTAIAVLSKQVDDMTRVLNEAKQSASASSTQLDEKSAQAEDVANRLEVMLSALEDLPDITPGSDTTSEDVPDAPQKPVEPESHPQDTASVFLRHSNRAAGGRA